MADYSTQTFTNLLGLAGFCALHVLPAPDGSLQITVAANVRMGVCPHCQTVASEVHQTRPSQDVHDLPLGRARVRLKVLVDQYKCDPCGKAFTPAIPFLADGAHATDEQAAKLMHSPKTKAFDISAESAKTRDLYGRSKLGESALLARRLVETGVRFVEIRQDGWDTHKDTVGRVKKLSAELDPALAGLITDLKQHGMLDDTLVIMMGEFGRSPANGSNHFSRAWTTVLAGGGLKHGQAIGSTGSSGGTVDCKPIATGDFMTTVCKALGITYEEDWQIGTGRPIPKVVKGSQPVKELFA